MRQRSAEQLDGVGVDQLAQQRAAAVAPQRREVVERPVGLGVLANPKAASFRRRRRRRRGARVVRPRSARSCQLASQWCMPVQAVRVVELCGDHRRHAERDQVAAVLGGQRAQHPHQRQVGRRPRLVEPFLADRPAAVMGQPRQMGVQDEGEQPGYRASRAAGRHGRTAIATRSRLSSMSAVGGVEEVEVVGASPTRRRRAGRRATARRPARGRSGRR